MSNFWDLNDGTSAVNTDGNFELGNGDPIPKDTGVLAASEEAKWDFWEDDEFISIRWRVAKPDIYANRVVFQKVKVFGTSRDKDRNATADKHKRMLAAIDANAGGGLARLGRKPTDEDLMRCLAGKMMGLKLGVWESEDKSKSGNWVSAVSPAKGGAKQAAPVQAKKAAEPIVPPASDSFEDDIPF